MNLQEVAGGDRAVVSNGALGVSRVVGDGLAVSDSPAVGGNRITSAVRDPLIRAVRRSPALEVLPGLWTRSLIAWADGRRDTTTQVFWLQGPGFFADLRQPAGAPDFSRVRRLADIDDTQLEWMSKQDAFAGDLQFDGDVFEWERAINLQPPGDRADRGRLVFENGVLVERGELGDYIEHWHRTREPRSPGAARLLDEKTGCIAYLIRVDSLFMYARGRDLAAAPAGVAERAATLTDAIRSAPTPEAARRLLDLEVAFGQVENCVWRIQRSSLPFRCGQSLDVLATGSLTLSLMDSHFDLGSRKRHWRIVDLRGDLPIPFYPAAARNP
jgi:hypothetical protein